MHPMHDTSRFRRDHRQFALGALLLVAACTDAPAPVAPVHAGPSPGATIAAGGVIQIGAGGEYTCALKADGTIACWGFSSQGATSPPSGTFTRMSVGYSDSCALRPDGTVACWGYTAYGATNAPGGVFTDVSAGPIHTCGIRPDNTIVCWGNNNFGQASAPIGTFTQVSASYLQSCGLRTDGSLACWGGGAGVPRPPTGNNFVAVSVGELAACALESDASAMCWSNSPITVPNEALTQLSANSQNACGLRTDGTITCWGISDYGITNTPTGAFVQVSVGWTHACALRADGTFTCWGGNNRYGELNPPSAGATATGSNVQITPLDATTGQPSPASITFANVTGGGETTVTSGSVGQGGGPPAPGGFRLGNPPTYYDISTTAVFTGSVTVCFDYSEVSYANTNMLTLLHYVNGTWVDITTSLDTQSQKICGTTSSLSPFLVAQTQYDFSGFFRPVDNVDANGNYILNQAKAGSAIPVKFSLHGNLGLDILASGYPKSELIACVGTTTVDGITETVATGGSGITYDASTDQYSYVWKTDKSWTGCRQLTVKLNDGAEHKANFKFSK